MSSTWNKVLIPLAAVLLLFCAGLPFVVRAQYASTARDTKLPPERAEYTAFDPEGLEKLADAGPLSFYYRESRNVLTVVDNRNGYTWKTGLDLPANDELTDPETPREDKMNALYHALYNSLVTVEYYDSSNNVKTTASAAKGDAVARLATIDGDPAHRRLDVEFTKINLQLSVHIYLTETGLRFEIRDEEITGEGQSRLAAIQIAPYMGASGGQKLYYNAETGAYDLPVHNPAVPGYIFIPDGCGALMRFSAHTANLRRYVGRVYGNDVASGTYYILREGSAVPVKEPLMPVFGMAYGDRQAAFVGYASSGDEYMEIIVSPESGQSFYTNAYPRFVYNTQYYHVYNRQNDGYFKLTADRRHYDVVMHYQFLAGDGQSDGLAADYTGMARAYRAYLLETGVLQKAQTTAASIPLQVDFVMADSKKSIIGNQEVVTTTAAQAMDMIESIQNMGITHLSVGLMGAQSGGITGGKPWQLGFGNTGSKSDYRKLLAMDADISFRQDYLNINATQMSMTDNSARHLSGQLVRLMLDLGDENTTPISETYYARPDKSAGWLYKQAEAAKALGAESVTVDGITGMAVSDYGRNPIRLSEAIRIYQEALSSLDMKVNLSKPNQYLWQYTDRFLDTPMFTSSYIMETDTVPFLQMVLNGSMEVCGPYANLSFYTRADILRMIDYNVYPSFILTYEPSYLLAATQSSDFYSTEYSLYEPIIKSVYGETNQALSVVRGREWIGREVLAPGVVVNRYDGGVSIFINYTGDVFTAPDGTEVAAEGYRVRGA